MTLSYERTRAVVNTELFLRQLCDAKVTPSTPRIVREQAKALLRHYPTLNDIKMTVIGYHDPLVALVQECPFSKDIGVNYNNGI